jgi:hypothetical protein
MPALVVPDVEREGARGDGLGFERAGDGEDLVGDDPWEIVLQVERVDDAEAAGGLEVDAEATAIGGGVESEGGRVAVGGEGDPAADREGRGAREPDLQACGEGGDAGLAIEAAATALGLPEAAAPQAEGAGRVVGEVEADADGLGLGGAYEAEEAGGGGADESEEQCSKGYLAQDALAAGVGLC